MQMKEYIEDNKINHSDPRIVITKPNLNKVHHNIFQFITISQIGVG